MNDVIFLRASEIAAMCGVTKRSITNWCAHQKMPHYKTKGGHLRFNPAEVLNWFYENDMPVPEALKEL